MGRGGGTGLFSVVSKICFHFCGALRQPLPLNMGLKWSLWNVVPIALLVFYLDAIYFEKIARNHFQNSDLLGGAPPPMPPHKGKPCSWGCDFTEKTTNFRAFLDDLCSISRQPLERFWRNMLLSETKWIKSQMVWDTKLLSARIHQNWPGWSNAVIFNSRGST